MPGLLETVGRGRDCAHFLLGQRIANSLDRILDSSLERGLDLVAVLLEILLDLVSKAVGPIARLDALFVFPILRGMLLGFAHHALDIALAEPARRLDANTLLLSGSAIFGGNVENAVGVDVERHLDLWNSTRRGREPIEMEPPDGLVVASHRTLALKNVDLHTGLT